MQKEIINKGYTMVPNRVLENLALIKLSPTQHSLIFVIWRNTYGFLRDSHNMSLSFLSKATGCDLRNIQRELKRLENRNIIKQSIEGNKRIIGFNEKIHEWDKCIAKTTIGETDNGETDYRLNRQGSIGETTVETFGETTNQEINRENIKKSGSIAKISIDDFFEEIWILLPERCRKGKLKVTKQSKQAIYRTGREKMIIAIENYKKELERESWKNPMHGNTFLNDKRYEEYFESEQINKEEVLLNLL